MSIFIIGNSGVGKTTLCNKLAEYLNVPYCKEVIRLAPGKSQVGYLLEYAKVHERGERLVSDRSILDIMCWNKWNDLLPFLLTMKKPELVILTPVPSLEFIISNIDHWTNDPVRLNAYLSRWNVSREDGYDLPDENLALRLYGSFLLDYAILENYLDQLSWNYKAPVPDTENYYKWQEDAVTMIDEYLEKVNAA